MKRARTASVVIALPLLGAACDGAAAPPPLPAAGAPESWQPAVAALCEAEVAASGGAVPEASRRFQDDAHAALHRLATILQRRDRAAAARLLEAKVRVESALEARGDPAIADLIRDLREATEEGAAAAGSPVVGCPV